MKEAALAEYVMAHGESLLVEFEVSNLGASGITGCLLSFTAKKDVADSDTTPGVIRRNTADFAVINDGTGLYPAIVDMDITPADTAALPANRTTILHYDVCMQLPDGRRFTVEVGTVTVELAVTTRVMS